MSYVKYCMSVWQSEHVPDFDFKVFEGIPCIITDINYIRKLNQEEAQNNIDKNSNDIDHIKLYANKQICNQKANNDRKMQTKIPYPRAGVNYYKYMQPGTLRPTSKKQLIAGKFCCGNNQSNNTNAIQQCSQSTLQKR